MKIFATIILLISITGVILCSTYGGRQIDRKDYRGAFGLFGCALVFLVIMMGIML